MADLIIVNLLTLTMNNALLTLTMNNATKQTMDRQR
jgi:hypothetical protein